MGILSTQNQLAKGFRFIIGLFDKGFYLFSVVLQLQSKDRVTTLLTFKEAKKSLEKEETTTQDWKLESSLYRKWLTDIMKIERRGSYNHWISHNQILAALGFSFLLRDSGQRHNPLTGFYELLIEVYYI